MRYGVISRKDAEYIMGAASVAGGYVLTPGEVGNVCRTFDHIDGLLRDGYFAALPTNWSDVKIIPLDRDTVVKWLQEDLARNSERTWGTGSKENDIASIKELLLVVQSA